MHFDDFEMWTLDINSSNVTDGTDNHNEIYLPYVLVHEIGHSLGLGHSMRQQAIMNPIYKQTPLDQIKLDIDDQCAANWNYVGPSKTCMFIWLMVEYLPTINDTSSGLSSAPATFTLNVRNDGEAVGEMALQSRVSNALDSIQASKIPRCHPNNKQESHFVNALIRKLAFPPKAAKKYGAVVCKYMQGLYDVVRKRQQAHSNADAGLDLLYRSPIFTKQHSDWHSTSMEQMRVHNYMSRPRSHSLADFERHLKTETAYSTYSYSDSQETDSASHQHVDGIANSPVLNVNFQNPLAAEQHFDEAFFREIIKSFLTL